MRKSYEANSAAEFPDETDLTPSLSGDGGAWRHVAMEGPLLLEIDFEGATYCWTGTVWVDQRFIRVPALLASRLARFVAADGLVLPATTNEERQAWPPRGADRSGALDYELSRDNHLLISANVSRAW